MTTFTITQIEADGTEFETTLNTPLLTIDYLNAAMENADDTVNVFLSRCTNENVMLFKGVENPSEKISLKSRDILEKTIIDFHAEMTEIISKKP